MDLRHLSRNIRRSPASAAAAVLTLSLTLGATASIFAVVHAVLLTPPPFKDPNALVALGETPINEATGTARAVSYETFQAWRERAGSVASLEAYDGTNLTLTALGTAERLSATDVTPGFLNLLGVTPALGRTFEVADIGQPVTIVSNSFWRGKLGGNQAVIGRQLVLGGQTHTIVGVLPEQFVFELNPSDVWRPLPLAPSQAAPAGYRVHVLARLGPNVSPRSIGIALDDVSRASTPPARAVTTFVGTAIAGNATKMVGLLGAAAALAMLIAFTNFAGILVVRSIDRRRELAVRSALGARRSEIVRQVMLEAQALVLMGTFGGVILALWMTPAVARVVLEQFGGLAQRHVVVNWQVIAFMVLIASACACACASLPAFIAARQSVLDVLRRGATSAPRELMLRRLFVVGEVALAFVLLVSVTLLGRSLLRVLDTYPGFDARGVMTLQVSLPRASYASPQRVASFYAALQRSLEERLGPRAVSIVDELPLTGDGGRSLVSLRSTEPGLEVVVRSTTPGYFDVMRIPVARGRSFEPMDDDTVPPRVVINRTLAARLFGTEQTIGRSIWFAGQSQSAEIVGVVGDVKHRALDEMPLPTVYLSALQMPSPSSVVVTRAARPDTDVITMVREEVSKLDARLPVYRVRQMSDVVAGSPGVPARRVLTATFTGFALLALVLGAIGLFGVLAHDVAARRAEFAVRIALGADPMRILGATFGQGALMMGVGLVVGGILAIWAARALSEVGFAAAGFDAVSVILPALVLLLAGVPAILPAARGAARTDPAMVLRSE